jgi:hypothetical protein
MAKHPFAAALAVLCTGASLFVAGPARAQLNPAPPVQAVPPDKAVPGAPIPEQIAPPAAKGGVITPPIGVDPGIRKPVPDPNPDAMAVIPPPGTPGGNQSVQPK